MNGTLLSRLKKKDLKFLKKYVKGELSFVELKRSIKHSAPQTSVITWEYILDLKSITLTHYKVEKGKVYFYSYNKLIRFLTGAWSRTSPHSLLAKDLKLTKTPKYEL